MSLLNYSTQISLTRTIGEIHRCLASHGANAILTEYNSENHVTALSFKIKTNNNQDVAYRLPANWKPVLKIMEQDRKIPRRLCTQEQAIRVSWRIVKRWIEAQMAILETEMVKMEQIFLPYMLAKDGKTLSEHFEENSLKLLE